MSEKLLLQDKIGSVELLEVFGSDRHANEAGKVISFGLSGYGYDIRVANEFKVFTNAYNSIIDHKLFRDDAFVEMKSDICVVPPTLLRLLVALSILKFLAKFLMLSEVVNI